MNKIKEFVEKTFENTLMNEELEAQKEELILNMSDKYNSLLAEGKGEDEAYREVIDNFGSGEEIKEALNTKEQSPKIKKRINEKFLVSVIGIVIIALLGTSSMNYINQRQNYMLIDIQKVAWEFNRVVFYAKNSNN